jgi:hypothetical protein
MKHLKDMYLSTFTGKRFHPFNPSPDQIDIQDIAHWLSLLCFSGQCPQFYSVAEHSIYVATGLPNEFKLEGLLHDASEAYLADVPRPLKIGLPEYKIIETSVDAVIAEKFHMAFPAPSQVKAADRRLLRREVFTFFGAKRYFEDFGEKYCDDEPEHDFGISPETAENMFLDLYRDLTLATISDEAAAHPTQKD